MYCEIYLVAYFVFGLMDNRLRLNILVPELEPATVYGSVVSYLVSKIDIINNAVSLIIQNEFNFVY